MRGKYTLKVPGGKLLKVFLEHEGGRIKRIRVTGDFFIHPEETLEELEKRLDGAKLQHVDERIEDFLKTKKPVMFGITKESLKEAIKKCVR